MNNRNNILFILDWDDTLFPTSWIAQNNINIEKLDHISPYAIYFSELDNMLYKLFYRLVHYGQIIIITNASMGWILASIKLIPKTFNIINNYVKIISARDKYQLTLPLEMWKKYVFNHDILPYIKNIKQIISIGDAEYEFNALIDLIHHPNYKNKYLKSIRLLRNPKFDVLIDQIDIVTNNILLLCSIHRHMDLLFTPQ